MKCWNWSNIHLTLQPSSYQELNTSTPMDTWPWFDCESYRVWLTLFHVISHSPIALAHAKTNKRLKEIFSLKHCFRLLIYRATRRIQMSVRSIFLTEMVVLLIKNCQLFLAWLCIATQTKHNSSYVLCDGPGGMVMNGFIMWLRIGPWRKPFWSHFPLSNSYDAIMII